MERGITHGNIGKLYLEKSKFQQLKYYFEKSFEMIHPDVRPHYPNVMNWLAACEQMIANEQKERKKQADKR